MTNGSFINFVTQLKEGGDKHFCYELIKSECAMVNSALRRGEEGQILSKVELRNLGTGLK